MVLLTGLPPSIWTVAKFAIVGMSTNSSLRALLMCLPIVFTSLPKRDAICCRLSHTVSFSTRTSSRMVSSGWYITISPLLPDSMLCILSNLEFNTFVGCKITHNQSDHQPISPKISILNFFKTKSKVFPPFCRKSGSLSQQTRVEITRSIHLCICLWLGFDCGSSNGQKQSINDAFQYVAVPPIRPKRGYGRCKDTNYLRILLIFDRKTFKDWKNRPKSLRIRTWKINKIDAYAAWGRGRPASSRRMLRRRVMSFSVKRCLCAKSKVERPSSSIWWSSSVKRPHLVYFLIHIRLVVMFRRTSSEENSSVSGRARSSFVRWRSWRRMQSEIRLSLLSWSVSRQRYTQNGP